MGDMVYRCDIGDVGHIVDMSYNGDISDMVTQLIWVIIMILRMLFIWVILVNFEFWVIWITWGI